MTCKTPVKMASEILRLTDGTTTVDFKSAKIKAMPGGVLMPPPPMQNRFISSVFTDGDRFASSRFANRVITINILLNGNSLDNLQTQVRNIERLLNDAKYRRLLGQGSQVYLEYQWGLTPNESVFFDVLAGELILPRDFSRKMMWYHNTIVNARVVLTCKPFGRYTNQTIASDTIENSQSTADVVISSLTDNADHLINALNDWEGQTFTTVGAITITHVAFKAYRGGVGHLPGNVTVSIYATAAGVPAGAALRTGTADSDEMGYFSAAPDWIVVALSTPLALSAATVYAFTVNFAAAGAAETINIRADNTAPYAGGTRVYSTDGGASWNIDASDDLAFAIMIAEAQQNWQDITTAASYGDIPARLYQQLTQAGAFAAPRKVWIAKRTGSRQTDDLWLEGGEFSAATAVSGGDFITEAWDESSEEAARHWFYAAGGLATDRTMGHLDYTISTLPLGRYRVLAKCRIVAQDAADFDHVGFAIGWVYGDRTYEPILTGVTIDRTKYSTIIQNNFYQILDLGVLDIPPIPESDIATDSSLELRIYLGSMDALIGNEYYKADVVFIFLLPIDEGVVIIDDVAAADLIGMDGITERKNVFILSAGGAIEDLPDIEGAPFSLGRENTRIYVLRDDDKDMSWTSDITYQPQFMQV